MQAQSPGREGPSRLLLTLLSLALVAVTLAVYAQVRHFGFIEYDDSCYLYDNYTVKQGLTVSGIKWAFSTFFAANYHPLTWLSLMLDCQVFGKNAPAHHLINLGYHVAATVILFLAFVRMTRRPWRSAIVAAVFAVHPIHAESVAWIAERKDVLHGFFFAATLYLYARYAEKRSLLRYLPMALAAILGLLSKSMLVTLPFVLLLLDFWPLGRVAWPPSWKTLKLLILEKIPLFACAAAVSVLTYRAQQWGGAVADLGRVSVWYRFANATVSYVAYIGKSFWPMKLAVLYVYRPQPTDIALGAMVILAVATAVAAYQAVKRPYLIVGWLWYLGMLVPVIGLVQVGAQSMADRYAYLPLVGFSAALVWLVADLVENRPATRHVVAGVTCAALLLMAVQGYRQVRYWRSSEALFEHSIAVTDRNHIMHKCLAIAFDHDGKTDEAIAEYQAALAIKPDFAEAHNGLGMMLNRKGKRDEAVAEYELALKYQPNFPEAHNNLGAILDIEGKHKEAEEHYRQAMGNIAGTGGLAGAHKNLGMLLAKEGKRDEAIKEYEQALAIDPEYAEAHNNLGVLLAGMGRNDEAVMHYRKAISSKPDSSDARANLGHELLRQGKLDEAYKELAKAVELDPKLYEAQSDMGTLLAAQGKYDEARKHIEESLKLKGDQPDAHSNLAFVLERLGLNDEAISHCNETLRLKPDSVDAHFNLAVAYANLGRKADAISEFSKVVALNPNHAAAKNALQQLQGAK